MAVFGGAIFWINSSLSCRLQSKEIIFYFSHNWVKSNWVPIAVGYKQTYIGREYIFGM